MRRKYLGMAIAMLATLGPAYAWGGDREIAETIIGRLKDSRDSGALKHFSLDMKVDKGIVLFRGNVNDQSQKNLVLKSANGIEGIEKVVDELGIQPSVVKAEPKVAKSDAKPMTTEPEFTLREALNAEVHEMMAEKQEPGPKDLTTRELLLPAPVKLPTEAPENVAVAAPQGQEVVPGEVRPATAVETLSSNDQRIVSEVVSRLKHAQDMGTLKGFGVDVKSDNGIVALKGRAASSAQRARIIQLANSVAGVQRVHNQIQVSPIAAKQQSRLPQPLAASRMKTQAAPQMQHLQTQAAARQPEPRLPEPPALASVSRQVNTRLSPVAVDPVSAPMTTNPVANARTAPAVPNVQPAPAIAQTAPYRAAPMQRPLQVQPVNTMIGGGMPGAPVMGTPVPMSGHGGAIGAPRYDSPYLPNYAWPGYAAYPNYAALTYPQQYSPSAWPYIGPFYPYPQVPLGWRKVSLEWDDGWWHLDFTDR